MSRYNDADRELVVDTEESEVYALVTELQAFMHKRIPPEETVNRIKFHFATPAVFIEANRYMLMRAGLPRLDAYYYIMIPGLTRTVMKELHGKKPRLNKLSLMAEFLKSLYIGIHVECFYLIMLDYYGKLIDARLMQKGNEESAPFYMRDAVSMAVQRGARAVVLSHNHPGGTLRPSKDDQLCTLRMMRALQPLNIPMLDHVIIAKDRAVSMRGCGFINAALWSMQQPQTKLLREWLDVDLLTDE